VIRVAELKVVLRVIENTAAVKCIRNRSIVLPALILEPVTQVTLQVNPSAEGFRRSSGNTQLHTFYRIGGKKGTIMSDFKFAQVQVTGQQKGKPLQLSFKRRHAV